MIKLVARNAFGFRNADSRRLRTRCVTTRRVRGHLRTAWLRRPGMGLRSSRAFRQAVNIGSIGAHRASDRSLGYGFRSITACRDLVHAGGLDSAGPQAMPGHLRTRRISGHGSVRGGWSSLRPEEGRSPPMRKAAQNKAETRAAYRAGPPKRPAGPVSVAQTDQGRRDSVIMRQTRRHRPDIACPALRSVHRTRP